MTSVELIDWPVARSAEEEHAALFGALNTMARLRDVVLERLPVLADDQLLQMWHYAREWGSCAWLIQCAICCEEKRRADRQSGGRARADTSGTGVCAAVTRRALRRVHADPLVSAAGCGPARRGGTACGL